MWKPIPMKPRADSTAPFAGEPEGGCAPVVHIRGIDAVRFELVETLRNDDRRNRQQEEKSGHGAFEKQSRGFL
jgi:hypothetical protein